MYWRVHLRILLQIMCCSFDWLKSCSLSWERRGLLGKTHMVHVPHTTHKVHIAFFKLFWPSFAEECQNKVILNSATACAEIITECTWPVLVRNLLFFASKVHQKTAKSKSHVELRRTTAAMMLSSPLRDRRMMCSNFPQPVFGKRAQK